MTRIQFREGQLLHAADLNDESAYLLSLRRRHDAGLHGWGIVSGLRLEIEYGGFVVNPGFAWDGYGRALIVQQEIYRPWQLPADLGGSENLFEHMGSSAVDVWLLYDRRPLRPDGRCHDRQPTRWQETARLCFTPAEDVEDRPNFNPRQPWGVPPSDLQIGPHQALKDDPQQLWPVYLGTLISNSETVEVTRRPYASLVGQRVISASRQPQPEDEDAEIAPPPVPRAELILDGESRLPRPHRFAVRIPDENGKPIERLAVERPGRATLRGDTTLISDRPINTRTDASDWILAEVDQSFTLDDLCDPEAILCRSADFASGLPISMWSKPGETEPPAKGPQAALLFLNNMLMRPELDKDPQIINISKRPITEKLIALAQQTATHVSPRYYSYGAGQDQVTYVQLVRNRFLLEDYFGAALCRRGPARAYTLGFNPLADPPEEALPWSAYRTDVPADEETGEPERRQLRFEFNEFGEKEHPERSQFVVGYFDQNEPLKFRACLSIDERCTVRIDGDLNVTGDVVHRPPPPLPPGSPGSPGLSQPTFEEALASQPVASSMLNVTIQGFAPAGGTNWPYDLRIENIGGQTLRTVIALENFLINNDPPSETRIVGGLAELDPGDNGIVPVVHTANISGGVEVSVQITVMAFTPDSKVMYAQAPAGPVLTS